MSGRDFDTPLSVSANTASTKINLSSNHNGVVGPHIATIFPTRYAELDEQVETEELRNDIPLSVPRTKNVGSTGVIENKKTLMLQNVLDILPSKLSIYESLDEEVGHEYNAAEIQSAETNKTRNSDNFKQLDLKINPLYSKPLSVLAHVDSSCMKGRINTAEEHCQNPFTRNEVSSNVDKTKIISNAEQKLIEVPANCEEDDDNEFDEEDEVDDANHQSECKKVIALSVYSEDRKNQTEEEEDWRTYSRTNPFANDKPLHAETIKSNPFNNDIYERTEHLHVSKREPTVSSNPFQEENEDGGILEDPRDVNKVTNKTLITPVQKLDDEVYLTLMDRLSSLGFFESAVKDVLKETGNDFEAALGLLCSKISSESDCIKGSNVVVKNGYTSGSLKPTSTWKPPFTIRIASWLPSSTEKTSESSPEKLGHIDYFVTVQSNDNRPEPPVSWKVCRRYSHFYNLFCKLHSDILSAYPNGKMNNPFKDDRLSTFMWGVSETVCHERVRMLDGWLREIVLSPAMMTRIHVFEHLARFLDINVHLKDRRALSQESRRVELTMARKAVPTRSGSSSGVTSREMKENNFASTPISTQLKVGPLLAPVKPHRLGRQSSVTAVDGSTKGLKGESVFSGRSSEPHGDYHGPI